MNEVVHSEKMCFDLTCSRGITCSFLYPLRALFHELSELHWMGARHHLSSFHASKQDHRTLYDQQLVPTAVLYTYLAGAALNFTACFILVTTCGFIGY